MLENLTILYAEDEDFIRENIQETLEFMSMKVIAVNNGEDAYNEYLKNKPDIVIADIEMPKLNGLQLASKIRERDKKTQIIITTAYADQIYLLKAVELHLTKYLLKPIHISELKSALALCKSNLEGASKIKKFNETSYYDLIDRKLVVDNVEVKTDFNEKRLLELLLKYSNQVISYEQIENSIWEYGMNISSLRTLVKRLRQKLPDESIQNIAKTGYKIVTVP